jgi:hypothetical protein
MAYLDFSYLYFFNFLCKILNNITNKQYILISKVINCDVCRVARDQRICDEPRISRVSIREIDSPLPLQPTTVYIISIRLTNH